MNDPYGDRNYYNQQQGYDPYNQTQYPDYQQYPQQPYPQQQYEYQPAQQQYPPPQQQQYQQYPYPYQPPPKKDNSKIIIIIIVVVVLFLVLPIIAGFLWVMSVPLESEEISSIMITAKNPAEKSYGYQIEITRTSGTLALEDAKFQVVNSEGVLLYSITISDTNPAPFNKGSSTVYAMTKGYSSVKDAGGNTVDGDDALSVYSGCYIAYLDQTGDGKINGGDSFYVYKDFDADDVDEVRSNHEIKIFSGNEMALNKAL